MLIPDFRHPSQTGLCAHPACLSALIVAASQAQPNGLLRFALKLSNDRGILDEFYSHCCEFLLREARLGKKTVFNPVSIKFCCLKFLAQLARLERDERAQQALLEDVHQLIEQEADELLGLLAYSGFFASRDGRSAGASPEHALGQLEVLGLVAEEFGEHTLLYLLGELTPLEYMKTSGRTPAELPGLLDAVRQFYLKHVGAPADPGGGRPG